jgi:hypothetical protein
MTSVLTWKSLFINYFYLRLSSIFYWIRRTVNLFILLDLKLNAFISNSFEVLNTFLAIFNGLFTKKVYWVIWVDSIDILEIRFVTLWWFDEMHSFYTSIQLLKCGITLIIISKLLCQRQIANQLVVENIYFRVIGHMSNQLRCF